MRSGSRGRAIGWLALALLGALAVAGCGKKGPPLPPERTVPEPASALSARQVGDRVVLMLVPPKERTDGTPLSMSASLDIHLSLRTPPPDSPRTVLAQPAASYSIPASQWERYRKGDRLEIPLPLDRIVAALPSREEGWTILGKPLSFVVEIVEEAAHSSPTPVATVAACEAPAAPTGANAALVPDGILVTWDAAPDARAPVNVYRRDAGTVFPVEPAGTVIAPETRFLDTSVPPGRPVEYVLRRAPGAGCESADGKAFGVTWVDIFPPVRPEGLAAVEEEGVIRLFWRPNQEPDLRGYRVHRAEAREGEEPVEWMVLTRDAIVTTSYTDDQARPGVTYLYAVTAVDDAEPANESPRSEPARGILGPSS